MPWKGLACNNEGHVVGMDLAYKDLDGTLPTQIGDLTMLATGDSTEEDGIHANFLKYNSLVGTLPTEFGRLSLFRNAM